MLDKIIAAIAIALVDFLAKRVERGTIAKDADVDRARIDAAGRYVREWMRKSRASVGSGTSADGSKRDGKDLHHD